MPDAEDRAAHVEREAVDDMARLLMEAWEAAEGKSVNVSYVATFADMARAVLAALPQTGDAAAEVEVREIWALRWPDGETSSGMYSDDGSDYAEQAIRKAARLRGRPPHRDDHPHAVGDRARTRRRGRP